jgi:serine/threonine protein kinase
MPPEQARGDVRRLDARTDLWALGATLFRALSGERVHPVTTVSEHLIAAATEPARSLASVARDVPPELVALVDRALAFEQADRFQSAEAMRAAVARARSALSAREPQLELGPAAGDQTEDYSSDSPTRDAPLRGELVLDDASRSDALNELMRFQIAGSDVYFIDTIPLIEMIWADGQVQSAERRLLDQFLVSHVRNLNELSGRDAVTFEQGQAFVERFLSERPPPELLETLRALLVRVRLTDGPASVRDARRRILLEMCLDIGAACVAAYPHGDHERFCRAEKLAFERIFRSLG